MESSAVEISWPSSTVESFEPSFDIRIDEGNSSDTLDFPESTKSPACARQDIPKPPPLPRRRLNRAPAASCAVPRETKDLWEKLFIEGYGADVHIVTDDGSKIAAHHSILSIASPVLGNFLVQMQIKNHVRLRAIRIPGPSDAVRAFIRFLYSSCYDEEVMQKFVLHLLVLSHTYAVPSLKRVCEYTLEQGWLTKENVVDVLKLSRSCDAPRLSMVCLRMVVRDFKCISATEAWKVMRHADPALEQELLESVIEEDSDSTSKYFTSSGDLEMVCICGSDKLSITPLSLRRQERLKKVEEKKVYIQLHEAMEALLHICRDGCRTIGPCDKALKGNQVACGFPACKRLETLIRHFSGCRTKVPGRCVRCINMWQLLELHSRMCNDPDYCKVPLCRHFKVKVQQRSKKEEVEWKMLVSKVTAEKNAQKLLSFRRSSF